MGFSAKNVWDFLNVEKNGSSFDSDQYILIYVPFE